MIPFPFSSLLQLVVAGLLLIGVPVLLIGLLIGGLI
jgi:hypothetical protein